MTFTRFSSTDPADLAALLNRLGDELAAEQAGLGQTALWAKVANKPTTFPPSAHTHAWSAIQSKPATFPPSAHTHAVGDVTGLGSRLGTLEQDTGPRNLSALIPELTAGHWTIRRVGNLVYSNIYDVDIAATAGDYWQRNGFLPVGFQPPASSQYVHFTCAQRTLSTFTPGPFRVDRYGGVTIYGVTGKSVAVTAVWVTGDAFPLTPPGSPA